MEDRLNPDIREVQYGKRTLKTLTLYPLSIGDQFKVTDIITKVIQSLVSGQQQGRLNDFVFMSSVMAAMEENLGKILVLIADISEDEAKGIISELTNTQLMDIVEAVWTVNFEPALKKGKNLFERGRSLFDSKRSSPNSSGTILNTDLKTSTEKLLDKED